MENPTLSIIIPAYDEEKRIGSTLESVQAYIEQKQINVEIIVVINNTTDNTKDVVERYRSDMPYIKVIDLGIVPSKSGTKGYAIHKGMLEAKGAYVLFMDADNATDVREVEKMW